MQNDKLLRNRQIQISKSDKPKPEHAAERPMSELSKRQAQFLTPFRLELAGNRLSPLHEW